MRRTGEPPVQMSPFTPAWWLPGPHLQTVWGRLARPKRAVRFRREVLTTPDDDDLVVDHLDAPPGAPRIVLLHGLEGSSHSVYIQGLAGRLATRGAAVSVLNFRGCARDPARPSAPLPNRGRRLYHSGETSDLDFLLRSLAAREPGRRLAAIGVSLGGNVLLKWLGETAGGSGAGAPPRLAAAGTLSVPYDLGAGARGLESTLGRRYTAVFLKSLNHKVTLLLTRHPDLARVVDVRRARAARTFFAFDDAATAPLHGFAGADDYYERCSSLRVLDRIDTPTFCLSAADDPFLPAAALAAAEARANAAPAIRFMITPRGGHAGFVAGPAPGWSRYWGEDRVVEELLQRVGGPLE